MGRTATWLWLALLGAVCALETATHAGSHNGFLESSRPLYSQYSHWETLPAEGYVNWVGPVPVLQDAESFLKLTALFLGQQGPGDTGFLDRRAAYAYFASLVVPWTGGERGAYLAYLLLNGAAWWVTAAAAYSLVRRRWGDTSLAMVASLLVATGNGFVFMVGLPQSYVLAYAAMMLLLALAEHLGVWRRPGRLGPWLLLGWGAGVASTIYFTHIAISVFWWVYGLRRVAWRYLVAATIVAFGVSLAWEAFGARAVGLAFTTDNSQLVGVALQTTLGRLRLPASALVATLRSSDARGTVVGAVPYPFWPLALIGFLASRRDDREWALAVAMAGLAPTLAMLSLLALPRIAYFMYPAVCVMAAQGALVLARGAGALLGRRGHPPALAGGASALVVALAVGGLVLTSNLDLLGDNAISARFHYSAGFGW